MASPPILARTAGPEVCCYCLKESSQLTKDHIPPACLFPKPRHGLITLPSCEACNQSAKLDDEYFRLYISIRDGPGKTRRSRPVQDRALERLFVDPKKQGFFIGFMESMKEAARRNPRLERGDMVDLRRLRRVAARCVRGLYYHQTGYVLPSDWSTIAFTDSEFDFGWMPEPMAAEQDFPAAV